MTAYRSEVVSRLHSVSATPALSESVMNAPISESSLLSLTQGLLQAQELEALTIDLRQGTYWWSTRLFFLATIAQELVGTRLFIFVERGERYLGVATTETVRDRLAATKAPLRAFLEHCRQNPVDRTDLMKAMGQRSQHWQVSGVAKAESNLKAEVSGARLHRWLKTDLLTRSVARSGENVTTDFLRGIVDWPHPYVPITENGVLRQVVARAAVTSDLADLFVKSLDGARS